MLERMSEHTDPKSHIRSVDIWDSGGGVELEVIELKDGITLVVTDEVVTVYPSAKDFWEDETEPTLAIDRETGRLLEFAGAR